MWERFGAAVEKLGVDRSAYLREVMRWVVREPGAKQPKRPPAEEGRAQRAAVTAAPPAPAGRPAAGSAGRGGAKLAG